MRIRPILIGAGLAILSLSAQAHGLPGYQRPASDTTFSVLVYDRIGATPSIDLKRIVRVRQTGSAPKTQAEATREPALVAPTAQPRAPVAGKMSQR